MNNSKYSDNCTFLLKSSFKGERRHETQKKRGRSWVLDESKFLTTEEVRTLMRSAEKRKEKALRLGRKTPVRDWFLINLGLFTGLRVQEMADLRCGDIFVGNGRCSLVVRNGKGGKKRVVRLPEEFREVVREFLRWKSASGEPTDENSPLFYSRRRNGCISKRALQESFKRSAEAAGLGKSYFIHSLRHTYATHLLKASNYNLRLVQKQLGHSSIEVTEVYLSVLEPDLNHALKNLYVI